MAPPNSGPRRAARWFLVPIGVAFVAALACIVYLGSVIAAEGKATSTIVRMRELAAWLESERPADVSAPALAALLRKEGRPGDLEDGWGRPIEVTRIAPAPAGGSPYLLRSQGRDGARGPCCTPLAQSLDDDAVLNGEVWRQQWAPRNQRR